MFPKSSCALFIIGSKTERYEHITYIAPSFILYKIAQPVFHENRGTVNFTAQQNPLACIVLQLSVFPSRVHLGRLPARLLPPLAMPLLFSCLCHTRSLHPFSPSSHVFHHQNCQLPEFLMKNKLHYVLIIYRELPAWMKISTLFNTSPGSELGRPKTAGIYTHAYVLLLNRYWHIGHRDNV